LDLAVRKTVRAVQVMTARKRRKREEALSLVSGAKVMPMSTSNLKEMLILISQILKSKSKPTNQIST